MKLTNNLSTSQGSDGAGRSYSISHKKLGSSGSEARRKRGGSMDNLIDSIESSESFRWLVEFCIKCGYNFR